MVSEDGKKSRARNDNSPSGPFVVDRDTPLLVAFVPGHMIVTRTCILPLLPILLALHHTVHKPDMSIVHFTVVCSKLAMLAFKLSAFRSACYSLPVLLQNRRIHMG